MRVTNQLMQNSMIYNSSRSRKDMYDASEEYSSGTKIQQSYQDSGIFSDTMRLDYDITTLEQVKESSSKAQTFADNSDTVLNQFTESLSSMNTKLIKASNSGGASTTSMQAIANELTALRNSLKNEANSSINGQYLFSGSSTSQKPIDSDGNYMGNNGEMTTVVGSSVNIAYNIPGEDLFIGYDGDYSKIVETNVRLTDQTDTSTEKYLDADSTIEQLTGEDEGDSVFYLEGRKADGSTFATKFNLSPDNDMDDLLKKIGEEYGNTDNNELVNVSMNKSGQIVLKDNDPGSNVLEFHLVAATDTNAAAGSAGTADVDDLSTLPSDVKITEFIKGGRTDEDGNDATGANYDKTQFLKDGNTITGTVSQVVKGTDRFATDSTKLSDVAGGDLVGQEFTFTGKDINGTDFDATINFEANSTTFTVGGNTYNIYDAKSNQTPANEITYRQLNDAIAMVTSGTLPSSTGSASDYQDAIVDSRKTVDVNMDYRGQIKIEDKRNGDSNIEVSLYNSNSGQYDSAASNGTMLSFSANNAITIDGPYIDMFKDVDTMIAAVKGELNEADANSDDPRNPGIESAITRLQHISDHVTKSHTKVGALSNALSDAKDRATLLTVNVKSIQSNIIDADFGETYLKFQQAQMSYTAILQSISKINSLSLVNYM